MYNYIKYMVNELIQKLQNTGNPEEQIEIADEILEQIPFELSALITKGYAHIELEQYNEAIETFDRAIEFDAHHIATPPALNGKGVCYARQEDYAEALKCFEKCNKIDKENSTVIFNIAYMYLNLNENDKALEKFEEILKYNPDNIIAKFKIEEIKNGGDLEFHSIQEGLMKAQMYQQAYRYDDALKIYNQILNIQEDCIPAYNHQGHIYSELNQPDKAIKCYQKALEYQPKAQVAWSSMAMVYLNEGNFKKANECYDKALDLIPDDDVSLANNAFCLMQLGEFDKSIEMSKKSLEINPSSSVYCNIALCYEMQEDYENALEVYDEGLKNIPSPTLYNNKAWSLRKTKQFDDALKNYEKAIKIDGEKAPYLKNIAATYKEMGDLEKAHEYYDKAYALDSTIESFEDIGD